MQVAIYFSVVSVSITLLGLYCKSCKPAPLASIFLLIAMCHGLVFKPLLVFLSEDQDFLAIYILSGIKHEEFWRGGTFIACSFFCLIITIILLEFSAGQKMKLIKFRYYYKEPTIFYDTKLSSFFCGLGILSLVFFIILNPELLSFKGKNSLASDDIGQYSGNGPTRLIINFCNAVVFLMIHNVVVGTNKARSKKIGISSALVFVFFAVLSDQRALILFSVLSWGLFSIFCGARVSRNVFKISVLASFIMVIFNSFRRIVEGNTVNIDQVLNVLANFAGKNFIDITKTVAIFDAEYKLRYGSTFLDMFAILIPRSIFPDKKAVNIDTLIASDVFGINTFGAGAVPPGVIGEMIFNFGIISVPVGIIISGIIIWSIDFYRHYGNSFYLMFYTMSLCFVGLGIPGSSIQSTFVGFLLTGIPLFIVHISTLRRLRSTR